MDNILQPQFRSFFLIFRWDVLVFFNHKKRYDKERYDVIRFV